MPTLISHGYPGAMSKDVATRRLLQKEMRETMAFHATDRIAGAFSSECRLGVVEHGVIPQMFAFDGECKAELSILGSTSFFLGGEGRVEYLYKWQHASCHDFDLLGKSERSSPRSQEES